MFKFKLLIFFLFQSPFYRFASNFSQIRPSRQSYKTFSFFICISLLKLTVFCWLLIDIMLGVITILSRPLKVVNINWDEIKITNLISSFPLEICLWVELLDNIFNYLWFLLRKYHLVHVFKTYCSCWAYICRFHPQLQLWIIETADLRAKYNYVPSRRKFYTAPWKYAWTPQRIL